MARLCLGLMLLLTFGAFIDGTPRVRRLAGGFDAGIELFPYMAAIKYQNKFVCGGTIIGPNKILTAANCFWCKNQSMQECLPHLTVQTGSMDLSKGGSTNLVKDFKIAEGFIPGRFANDIAVVTLQSDIKFSATEKAAILPNEDITENTVAISSGWGTKSENSKLSTTLSSIKEQIIPSSDCSESLNRNNTNLAIDVNDFCAVGADGNTQAGLCVGDSGNPLVIDGKVIIGVSTWGIGCGRGYPDIFANVYKHLNFIKSQL